MFNGNYIKIDTAINEVSKYPFIEGLTRREAANSLVTLLGLIGTVLPLERTYKVIEIKSHKGALPNNIMFLHGVNNKGTNCSNRGVVMRYASDIYNSVLHSDLAKSECGATPSNKEMITLYGPADVGDIKVTGEVGTMNLQAFQVANSIPTGAVENSYTINGSSIDTSFPSGFIEIAYDAVKLDDKGFPMIPDDKPFRQAFKYFLLKNAMEPEYFRGNVSGSVYREINTQYDFYVGAAGNSFNMPNPDQMESMINGLVRILPNKNVKEGWKSFNKPERIV